MPTTSEKSDDFPLSPAIAKSLAAVEKQVAATTERYQQFQKIQEQVRKSFLQVNQVIINSNRGLKDHQREITATERAVSSLTSGLRNLATIAGIGSISYAVIGKVKSMIATEFDLALSGGHRMISKIQAMIRDSGIPSTSVFSLVSKFQGQSAFNRFGLGDSATRGLLSLQKSLQPVGLERAESLLLGVTHSLEPARLANVLKTANKDPELALLRSATGNNILEVTSALNALSLSTADKKEIDPMLAASMAMTKSLDKLNASIENLIAETTAKLLPAIEKIAGAISFVSDHLGSALGIGAAVGGAGLLYKLRRFIPSVGLPSFGAGGVGGTSPVSVTVTRVGQGFAPRGLLPMAGRGLGTTALAPYAGAGATGLPVGLAAIPLAMAVGGTLAAKSIADHTSELEQLAGDANAKAPLGQIAYQQKIAAKNRLDILKAKRLEIVSRIGQTPTSVEESYANSPGEINRKPLEALQTQLIKVNQEIDKLRQPAPARAFWETFKAGASKATEFAKEKLGQVEKFLLRGQVQILQRKAAEARQIELNAAEQGSVTALKRQEYQLSSMSIFGALNAMPQLRNLLAAIADDVSKQTERLKNTDESTSEGRIAANQIRGEVMNLRLEERGLRKQQIDAMMDSVVSTVSGAGSFQKILIDSSNNVAYALANGMIRKDIPEILGSVGASKNLQPIRATDFLQKENPFAQIQRQQRSTITTSTPEKATGNGIATLKKGLQIMLSGIDALEDNINRHESEIGKLDNNWRPGASRPRSLISG
jgi:hypothetical protein